MSITIREFIVAMETYGAKRLNDSLSPVRHDILVPCFNISGTYFLHSGLYYIISRGNNVPVKVMERAMSEFSEKHPGGDNFWNEEIHTIKGLLTLVAMLEGKYSKSLVEEMTNRTYKKLLNCSLIKNNYPLPFHENHAGKMDILYKTLDEYKNIVNPYGNNELDLKDPIEYLDCINVSLEKWEGKNPYTSLILSSNSCQAKYKEDENGCFYDSVVPIQKDYKNGHIHLEYYCENENGINPVDELVHFYYKFDEECYMINPNDLDLKISLQTGLAWQDNKKMLAKPVTDAQIGIMLFHLKVTIKKIKYNMVKHMMQ